MSSTIAIRLAHADEAPAVRRLAALDSAAAPHGDVLLALVDGRPTAALALADGRVVADPFVPTEDLVALLRVRARALAASVPRSPRERVRRLRLPAAA
jgi:hypothetical protein